MSYTFSQDDAQRIQRVVRVYETDSRRANRQQDMRPSIADTIRRGVTLGSIGGRSGSSSPYSPGTGLIQFYQYDRDERTISLTPSGVYGHEVPILNDWDVAVSGDIEAVCYWRGGEWWLLNADSC